MVKLRVKFCKKQRCRFISHLDLLRTFERSLRRADLPIAFSQGFNPHPKISFGSVLPLGLESEGEYVDFILTEECSPDQFKHKLNQVLPSGLSILAVQQIPMDTPSLMEEINLAVYTLKVYFKFPIKGEKLSGLIADFLSKEEILILRKSKKGIKEVNIRPLIKKLDLIETSEEQKEKQEWDLSLVARTGSMGNLRADQLIEELTKFLPDLEFILADRTGLYIKENEKIYCPLNKQIVRE